MAEVNVPPRARSSHPRRTVHTRHSERRVRPNLRRHIRQFRGYLDRYIDDLGSVPDEDDERVGASGGWWDSVSGILLYPRRPTDAARLRLVDDLTLREVIAVAWYDDTDWVTSATAAPSVSPTR